MSLPAHLLIHDVTIIHPDETTDDRGNTVYDYGAAATRVADRVWLQQDSRTERFPDGRTPDEETWLMMGNTSDLHDQDRVEWADAPGGNKLVFEVHGPPEPAYNAAGYHHNETTLRILEG